MLIPKRGKPVKDHAHMGKVARLPCVVCHASPVQVHHCIHDRHSQRRASDRETIPLCPACHAELHRAPATWRRTHGPDHGYLPHVAALIERMESETI